MSGPKRTIDFAVISESFELVKNNWLPFCLWSLMGIVASYGINFIITLPVTISQAALPATTDFGEAIARQIAALPFSIAGSIASQALNGLVIGGASLMTFKALRNERVDVADGFECMKHAGPLMLGGALVGFCTWLGLFACILGALVVASFLFLTYPVIVHEKLGVIDAMKRSANLMQSNWLLGAALVLVMGLIGGAGFLLCCLPGFFTMAMFYVTAPLIYRDLSGALMPSATVGTTNYPRDHDASMPSYSGPASDNNDDTPDKPTPPQS